MQKMNERLIQIIEEMREGDKKMSRDFYFVITDSGDENKGEKEYETTALGWINVELGRHGIYETRGR